MFYDIMDRQPYFLKDGRDSQYYQSLSGARSKVFGNLTLTRIYGCVSE